jgi:hypothetical protein
MITMRYRTTFLLLVAMMLAMVPLVQMNQSEARCEVKNRVADDDSLLGLFGSSNGDNSNPCFDVAPAVPEWARGVGFLSLACFGACLFSGFKNWRERRKETEMLRGAGFDTVDE